MDTGFFPTPTILGKRKNIERDNILVLRLAATLHVPEQSCEPESSGQQTSATKRAPIIINGSLVEDTKRRYRCTYDGCEKAYTKPSRLEEHERSHNGQRPFVCETCGNSYLRETHLHAHNRSHLPESSRPFECERQNCGKRFWTAQHLKTHTLWHDGVKPYMCTEGECRQSFSKHHLLRAHICAEHAPTGSKPYLCDHEGCSKSFHTSQHLRTHQKIHDEKRYTCVHTSCLPRTEDMPPYFPTWSALQAHIRTSHPPTCSSCNGRIFSNQGNLRAHLKLHEHREAEDEIDSRVDLESEADLPAKKKRRGGEYGRDWKCEVHGCGKDFKSKKALKIHLNVSHLGKRDFACNHPGCTQSFGYKHLLQRHHVKIHQSGPSIPSPHEEQPSDSNAEDHEDIFDIDMMTGNTYAKRAEERIKSTKALRCPFPFLHGLVEISAPLLPSASATCDYVFTRSYDARRHLKAYHSVTVTKDAMDNWVRLRKQASSNTVA